jgi:hypothetical protein
MNALATRFGRTVTQFRSATPLSENQIRGFAPSIYATDKHSSRSERYAYIPTGDILASLQREGFQPFMVAQCKTRIESMREHTKHMIRLRHASQITGQEAQEIILINSHNGSSSYQMLAGVFRFVCCNGLVSGDTMADIRIPHKGNVVDRVVSSAYEVLDGFTRVIEDRDNMARLTLSTEEQRIFGRAALALKYDEGKAPITEDKILEPRRVEDTDHDLWVILNRVQENLLRGGQRGRNTAGRVTHTRAVQGLDSNVRLNRALWVLASEMKNLRAP